MQTALVTGGTGYIGSHTVVELQQAGWNVIIVDNLVNSEKSVVDKIAKITGIAPMFYERDICSAKSLQDIFEQHEIDVVIHFAALKSVGESTLDPNRYFRNNLFSLINLLDAMEEARVGKLVFSSSATVYGEPSALPLKEDMSLNPSLSAYGSTKQMGEEILHKLAAANKIKAIALRYFNPVGAHESSLIGELPNGVPNNLLPFITQTASGRLAQLMVFGDDYKTRDGSCERDFIHVVDLAKAHVLACGHLLSGQQKTNYEVFNIGTGKPTSVFELINVFETVSERKLNYTIGKRRPGDAPVVFADPSKANDVLQWEAAFGLQEMVASAWEWELANQTKHVDE